jgi:hypothetical protein
VEVGRLLVVFAKFSFDFDLPEKPNKLLREYPLAVFLESVEEMDVEPSFWWACTPVLTVDTTLTLLSDLPIWIVLLVSPAEFAGVEGVGTRAAAISAVVNGVIKLVLSSSQNFKPCRASSASDICIAGEQLVDRPASFAFFRAIATPSNFAFVAGSNTGKADGGTESGWTLVCISDDDASVL